MVLKALAGEMNSLEDPSLVRVLSIGKRQRRKARSLDSLVCLHQGGVQIQLHAGYKSPIGATCPVSTCPVFPLAQWVSTFFYVWTPLEVLKSGTDPFEWQVWGFASFGSITAISRGPQVALAESELSTCGSSVPAPVPTH